MTLEQLNMLGNTFLTAWDVYQTNRISRQQNQLNKQAYNTNLNMQTSLLNRQMYARDVMQDNWNNSPRRFASFEEWLQLSPDAYDNSFSNARIR